MNSDEALFERLLGGQLGAFDELYARFERPLFGFIYSQLGDAAEAEDVLHEAFMAVLRARDERRSVRSFRAWLYGVAHHLCLNRVRSRKRAAKATEAVARVQASAEAPAELTVELAERAEGLRRAVERLPAPLGELYHLRAAGMSYQDAASVTGVPVGTVKSRMHEMIKRLKQEFGDMSHVESELVGYYFNEVEPEERARIEQHLMTCSSCCRAFVSLKHAIEVPGPAPSAAARERLRREVVSELSPRKRWELPLAFALAACTVLALGTAARVLTSGPGAAPHAISSP